MTRLGLGTHVIMAAAAAAAASDSVTPAAAQRWESLAVAPVGRLTGGTETGWLRRGRIAPPGRLGGGGPRRLGPDHDDPALTRDSAGRRRPRLSPSHTEPQADHRRSRIGFSASFQVPAMGIIIDLMLKSLLP